MSVLRAAYSTEIESRRRNKNNIIDFRRGKESKGEAKVFLGWGGEGGGVNGTTVVRLMDNLAGPRG